jgi:type IV pilus assembly protein PilA
MTVFLSKKQKLSNKGFTLVELIIVIAIIAILTAILVPNYVRYVEKSRWNRDRNQMETLINEVNSAVTYTLEEDQEVL